MRIQIVIDATYDDATVEDPSLFEKMLRNSVEEQISAGMLTPGEYVVLDDCDMTVQRSKKVQG